MAMRYLIIGAGPAGVNAAEHLRKYDPTGSITMLAAEDVPPYSRMALPYYLVGNIAAEGTYLRKSADHFERLAIDVKHGRASSVDTAAKRVTLMGGETLDYDKLLDRDAVRRPRVRRSRASTVTVCTTAGRSPTRTASSRTPSPARRRS